MNLIPNKIQIMVDSTAMLSRQEMADTGIGVIELPLLIGATTYYERPRGENGALLAALATPQAQQATTSQPAVGQVAERFQTALRQGYEVICILLGAQVSGTYSCCQLAARMVDGGRISVVDSGVGASALRFLALEAQKMVEEGHAREQIVSSLEARKGASAVLIAPRSLDHLRRSGRIGGIAAMLGSALNIRPVVRLQDALQTLGKARGEKRAMEMMLSALPAGARFIRVLHVGDPEGAARLQALVLSRVEGAQCDVEEASPVYAVHFGPGALGIAYAAAQA